MRYFLMFVFWGRTKNRKKYFSGKRNGLDNLVYQSKQSEIGHLLGFGVLTILFLILIVNGYHLVALLGMLLNIMGNMYPVILQRKHRARIDRIISGSDN